jgi:glucan biosynthesis protein C
MSSQTEQASSLLPGAASTAPPVQAAAASQGTRLLFIDNLRIVLICGVLVQHLAVTYGALGDWDYRDPSTNLLTGILLTIPNAIGMATGMGVFFLISAYFTPGSYDRKGAPSFLRDRLVRLGIPLLLYDLLLQPLVVYIAGGLHGSYWSFSGTYLLQMRGVTGVVWFLAVLLLFTFLYACWRGLNRHRPPAPESPGKPPSTRAIYGFIFALGLVTFVFRIWFSTVSRFQLLNLPLGYLPQYLSLYILGLVAYRRNWFFALTPRMGRDWLRNVLIAIVVLIVGATLFLVIEMIAGAGAAGTQMNYFEWVMGQLNSFLGGFHWQALVYALWEAFLVVAVSISLLALFRQRWNHQGRLAKSLAANAYTVYLIHPLVLISFAYAFHVVALYPLLKFVIAVLITLPLCFLISSLIRRIPLAIRIL